MINKPTPVRMSNSEYRRGQRKRGEETAERFTKPYEILKGKWLNLTWFLN